MEEEEEEKEEEEEEEEEATQWPKENRQKVQTTIHKAYTQT